jgi:hypothetical protein
MEILDGGRPLMCPRVWHSAVGQSCNELEVILAWNLGTQLSL